MNFPTSCHSASFWVFFTLAINQESPRAPPVPCWSLFPSARIPAGTVSAEKSQPSQSKHLQSACCSKDWKPGRGSGESSADVNPSLSLHLVKGSHCSGDGFLTTSSGLFSVFNCLKFSPAFYPFVWKLFSPLAFVISSFSSYHPDNFLSSLLTMELLRINSWIILSSSTFTILAVIHS